MKLKQTETITSFTGLPSSSADLSGAHRTPVFLSVRLYPNDVGLLLTPNTKFDWPNTPCLGFLGGVAFLPRTFLLPEALPLQSLSAELLLPPLLELSLLLTLQFRTW